MPSSPGVKDRVEQNPSDEEMRRVRPSLDLCSLLALILQNLTNRSYHVKSVNVAQCRLLTMQIGVCCWVSKRRTESCVATA